MTVNTNSQDLGEYSSLIQEDTIYHYTGSDGTQCFCQCEKIQQLKDKINKALEKANKYDLLMSANSEVVKKNIEITELYQNQHTDECRKAMMNESNFEVAIESNKALANENAKLHKKIRELQQAQQKLAKIEDRLSTFDNNKLTELLQYDNLPRSSDWELNIKETASMIANYFQSLLEEVEKN